MLCILWLANFIGLTRFEMVSISFQCKYIINFVNSDRPLIVHLTFSIFHRFLFFKRKYSVAENWKIYRIDYTLGSNLRKIFFIGRKFVTLTIEFVSVLPMHTWLVFNSLNLSNLLKRYSITLQILSRIESIIFLFCHL